MPSESKLKNIVEAALLAAGRPLSVDALLALFVDGEQPDRAEVRDVIETLAAEYAGRGIEVREVGSGWRIEVCSSYSPWVSRLWEEKPPRYSRALLETLALIAYRQPITRGEIEEIRGVSVSTNIVKTLLEREWVRVVGHRDVPGKPALYATTKAFLDYFGLSGLDDLPTLAEIKDLDSLNKEFSFMVEGAEAGTAEKPDESAGSPTEDTVPGESRGDETVDDALDAGKEDGPELADAPQDSGADTEMPGEPPIVPDVTH
jgi:segregation and condensation protein B